MVSLLTATITNRHINTCYRAILHDESRYKNPDTFNPSRFLTPAGKLDPGVPDPTEVFGNSRRICPGRYFAADILWLTVANILATFTIEKPIDEGGRDKEPSLAYTSGIFR